MGAAVILGYALQFVQAGFSLMEIKSKVDTMTAAGATEAEIHVYLKKLAHDSQTALENS